MMKKCFLLFFMMCLASLSYAKDTRHDVNFFNISNYQYQKVYYVVLGSFSSLKEAKRFNYYAPDGLECNIYRAKVKGKVVYRNCCNVFKTANEAHECAREIQKNYGINAWVWSSNGLANCVYHETGLSGEPLPLSPW